MPVTFSENANFIFDRLHSAGYECYAVGGCVRDSLRGVTPHDWDFATSALPDEIEQVFADCRLVTIGKTYGTIAVVLDGAQYEITTYRVDGDYTDARHPDEVRFSRSLHDDLLRRDFCVNAMAYNPIDGLIDEFDGQTDLRYGVIRCVGDPAARFSEDALRILRALRFSSALGFTIEPATENALLQQKDALEGIAAERLREELVRLLCGENVAPVLRRYRDVIAVFIPEIAGTFDFEQNNKHHNRDVYKHIVASVAGIRPDPVLRTTMFFHDIGKPMSRRIDRNGVSHYKGHQTLGAAMTREILRRLACSNRFTDEVCTLIKWHDERFCAETVRIKRCLREIGEDQMRRLLEVQRADTLAQSIYMREEKLASLSATEDELDRIIRSGECYSLRMLAVTGTDMIHMGVSSGRMIGEVLDECLDCVIEGELPNDREALLPFVRSRIEG